MTTEEINKKNRKWYEDNKEKVKANRKISYEVNKNKIKESQKKYREENKEKVKESKKKYRETNKDKIKIYKKKHDKINKNKKSIQEKERYKNNKEIIKVKHKEYIKERRHNDSSFKLKSNIRTTICNALKKNGFTKKSRTHQILDCSFEELKQFLESKFERWMTWNNYGKYNGQLNYGWDVDHIIPLSHANNEQEIIKLNHYTNLQPLCSYINRDIKRGNLI